MCKDNKLYCPIRKHMCVGKDCIFAVKIDDVLLYDPYRYNYVCGLVNKYDHGTPTYIDSEYRNDAWDD